MTNGVQSSDIKGCFVVNPNQWFANCGVQDPSPNNNPAADSMATFVAHELEESFTDPDRNAWFDVNGNENADKCVWTFGCSLPGFSGNWVNAKGEEQDRS